MILRGRITVYGEYLMKTRTRGLIIPSDLYLATSDHVDKPIHEDYDHSMDSVAGLLKRRNFVTECQIRGDLPFGFGLASSTTLAFLHTSRTLSIAHAITVVRDCDHEIHGFEPSGVDAAAISSQAPGFFSTSGWEGIQLCPIRCTLAFLPAERARALAEVEGCIMGSAATLSRIADALTNNVLATGVLDYGLLLDYSRALLSTPVYSKVAKSFIAEMLARGIVAKAIGGLYDKAILVVWANADAENQNVHLLHGFRSPPKP